MGFFDFLNSAGAGPDGNPWPWGLLSNNQVSPMDGERWPAGPVGAPVPAATPQAVPGIPAAMPWGALYPSPLAGPNPQDGAARNAAALGGMGIDPNNSGTPQISPFTVAPTSAPAPAAANGGFGAGATPFGFAGPGSNVVNPLQIIPPSPIGPPAPPAAAPQVAAAPASDLSSVNRGPAPAEPDSVVPVGNYQMPMFGEAPDAPEQPTRQPAAPVITGGSQAAPPFSLAGAGAGIGDRLMKATRGFIGNLHTGPIGALAGGAGALITGQNTDPTSIAAEQNSYTSKALLGKGASAAEVQAARYNPALQKALIEQYYGKDKWNVVQVGEVDGTKIYKQQNQVDGTLRDIPGVAAPGEAATTVTGPDGKQIPIPAGLTGAAKKEFLNKVAAANADAATGKQTEAQAKSSKFSTIATQADSVIKQLEAQGQSVWGPLTDKLPLGGAYAQSPEYQKYKAAKEAFLGAHLRDVSGAAIGSNEYVRAEKTFFPQPGEGPEAVAQKAALRAQLLQEMGRSAGPGYKAPGPSGTVSVGGSAINWSVK